MSARTPALDAQYAVAPLYRDHAGDRGGVDDHAAAVFNHVSERMFHPQPDASKVDRDDAIETFVAQLREEVAFALDACVVVYDVRDAEALDGFLDHRTGVGRF